MNGDNESLTKVSNTINLYFIAIIANIGALLFGYEIGSTSFLLLSIHTFAESNTDTYYNYLIDNAALIGFVMSGASLGAVITYPFLMFFANAVSKKSEILLAAFFFFIGALLESVSGYLDWNHAVGLVLLTLGRVIYGAGIACSFHAIPQYIVETVPVAGRGQFGSATEAMTMIGMTAGFGVGYAYGRRGWALTYVVACLTAVLMGECSLFLPNSPTWLVEHGYDDEEVLEALQFIFPHAQLSTVDMMRRHAALEHIRREEMERRIAHSSGNRRMRSVLAALGVNDRMAPELMLLLLDRTLRRSLYLTMFLCCLSVLSGQLPVIYYASAIFERLYPESVEMCVFGLILIKAAVAYIMVSAGEAFGRRQFYLVSTLGMAATMLVACVSFHLHWTVVCLQSLYAFAVTYELACGTLVWIVANELFPHHIRSIANALSVSLKFLFAFLAVLVLPSVEEAIGFSLLFLLFAASNLLCFYCVYVYLPETRGVPLEQAYLFVDQRFDNAPQPCGRTRLCGSEKDQHISIAVSVPPEDPFGGTLPSISHGDTYGATSDYSNNRQFNCSGGAAVGGVFSNDSWETDVAESESLLPR